METWTQEKRKELDSKFTTEAKVQFLIDNLKKNHWLQFQREWMEDELANLCDEYYFSLSHSLLIKSFEALNFPQDTVEMLMADRGGRYVQ